MPRTLRLVFFLLFLFIFGNAMFLFGRWTGGPYASQENANTRPSSTCTAPSVPMPTPASKNENDGSVLLSPPLPVQDRMHTGVIASQEVEQRNERKRVDGAKELSSKVSPRNDIGGTPSSVTSTLPLGGSTSPSSSPSLSSLSPVSSSSFEAAFAQYVVLHQQIVSGQKPPRYITYSPSGQLGNRWRGLLSCLVYGMLTNRACISSFSQGYYARIDDIFVSQGIEWEASLPPNAGAVLSLGNVGTNKEQLEHFLCTDITALSEAVVSFAGAFYFLPFLQANPHTATQMAAWFGDKNDYDVLRPTMAQTIVNAAFQPRREVWDLVHAFEQEHLGPDKYCVAMQIRNDNDPINDPWISAKEWESYRQCGRALLPEPLIASGKAVWFIATDSESSRQITQREMKGDSSIPLLFFGEFKRSNNADGVRHALADILIAARCEERLISPWSSYGRFMAVLSNRRAYVITDNVVPDRPEHPLEGTAQVGNTVCFRERTPEMCSWWENPKITYSEIIKEASCYKSEMGLEFC
jgi:hypothetical protein